MASNGVQEPVPEKGQILLVIHEFNARGSDELSLAKGDRVELVERDDDFGDGWYLGKHLTTGNTGLFPRVYTKIAPVQQETRPTDFEQPRSAPVVPQVQPVQQPQQPESIQEEESDYHSDYELPGITSEPQQTDQQKQQQTQNVSPQTNVSPTTQAQQPPTDRPETPILSEDVRFSVPAPQSPKTTEQLERHVSAGQVLDSHNTERPPLKTAAATESNTRPISSNGVTIPQSQTAPVTVSAVPKSMLTTSGAHTGADSPVMNETLSVIQEHITDMSTPRNSSHAEGKRSQSGLAPPDDSGSEYSSHIGGGHRMSYIAGSETDEEEEQVRRHQRSEVNRWSPEDVANYLASVGVEPKQCNVFKDQEITGDVLLGMDQAMVFLKEFELGTVGKRLKTWQAIKGLQDEVNDTTPPMGSQSGSRRQASTYGASEFGSDAGRGYSGYGTPKRLTSTGDTRPSSSRQAGRYSQRHRPMDSIDSQSTAYGEQPVRPSTGVQRPSAANIREMNHSRRQSSIDSPTLINTQPATPTTATASQSAAHKKLPSFDRNWTMGAQGGLMGSRPISQVISPVDETQDDMAANITRTTPFEFDRGYFSGAEADPSSRRNVLKKRAGSQSSQNRNSSYADEQRQRSATTVNRTSRYGSMDSISGAPTSPVSPAASKYYGLVNSKRTPDLGNAIKVPPKDVSSPTVTKLDDHNGKMKSPASAKSAQDPNWLKPSMEARQPGFRAISDAVTGGEKKMLGDSLRGQEQPMSPTSSTHSAAPTGDSTPSGTMSMDLDPSGSKALAGASKSKPKKGKKETSAYKSGLMKIGPKEAMQNCDYSGWMKKKSTNLMTTWKPRLFVLKGRRLSYYYSEDDTEEKGLIDISFHRVLPADNDRLTGLHATLTGASSAPATPALSGRLPTTAAADAKELESKGLTPKSESDANQIFIFKLVPPRAGLSRAVTFTKPTVHYFAVENVAVARLWMAALMKATIEREDNVVKTTYTQKTVSLRKAREMRSRPPALMGDDEVAEKKKEEKDNGKREAKEENGKSERQQGLGLRFGEDEILEVDETEERRPGQSKRRSYRGVDGP